MSLRADTTQLISGALVASLYPGHGIRGDAVPTGGTHAPSPWLNDALSAGAEYRWAIVTPPASGTLQPFEDGTYTYTPPGGTTDLAVSAVYRLYQDGVDQGTTTLSITIGSPASVLSATATITEVVDGAVVAAVDVSSSITATAAVVDAVDGQVAALVTVDSPPAGVEMLVDVAVLGAADGVVSAVVAVGSSAEPVPVLVPGARSIRAGRVRPMWLAPLLVGEVDNMTADFSPVLTAADPIVDVDVACMAIVGTDTAARPLLYGDWQVDRLYVRQRIQWGTGVPGVTYLVRVVATTANGRHVAAEGYIRVRPA